MVEENVEWGFPEHTKVLLLTIGRVIDLCTPHKVCNTNGHDSYQINNWLASCEHGWMKRNIKHVFILCSKFLDRQRALKQAAGAIDLYELLTTFKNARAAAKWLIQTDLLGQSSLASEQLHRR